MKLLAAPATPAPAPSPSVLGALKNIGNGLFQRTAKFAGYRAAAPTATTGVGSRIGTNTNSVWANMQRVGMNFTAEDVSKNSAIAWAYLASRQNYCSSQMTYIPATGDNALDKEITQYLHGYDGYGGKFATMGVDCSLQDAFMRTADIETPVRGDAGLIIHRDGDEIRLIEFSADQLGEIYQFTAPRTCGLSRRADGSLYESNGSDTIYLMGRYFQGCDCVAYRILQRNQSWYSNPVIYPASDVIYFHDPASYRGVRGVTFFANAIQHMAKGEDLLQAALSAAQRQARTYGRVFNNSGESDEASYETSANGNITFFEKVPGAPVEEFYYVGDQAEFAAPNTPSAEVIAGVETADERVAIALRLNYAFLISATKVGGAPSRLEINKAAKEFARIQNQIHRPRLRRIADIVLMDAVRRGDIVPPRGMSGEQFKRGRWMLPISPSVDAFYDATENIKMLRAGLESAEDIIAETNRNADDVLMKSKRWAVKCAQTVEDANAELVASGYKPSVTIADIAQVSDNPQQAAAAENIEQGKPAAGGNETDPKKQAVAALAEWDEAKHKRADDGKFGSGGGGSKESESPKNPAQKFRPVVAGNNLIHLTVRSDTPKWQVTSFEDDTMKVPTGHDGFNSLPEALAYAKYDGDEVSQMLGNIENSKRLSGSKDPMAIYFDALKQNTGASDQYSDATHVYSSPLRPMSGVKLSDSGAQVLHVRTASGRPSSVVLSSKPLSISELRNLDLAPIDKHAKSAMWKDVADEIHPGHDNQEQKTTAALAEFDESKHGRDDSGKFSADGASERANAHSMSKITGGDEQHHKLGAAYHREAAAKHRTEALRDEGSFSSESHKAQAENHEKFAELHDKQGAGLNARKEEAAK